jgi:cell division protein FtsQ
MTAHVAAHWLTTTPALAVTRLDVVGARRVPEDAVRRAAAVSPGLNLLALDPGALAGRVEALTGVRRALVVRHLPGRVTVVVEEREPHALLNVGAALDREARLQWIDREGRLVANDDRPGAPGQPILAGARPVQADPDPVEAERLRAGLGLLRVLQDVGPRLAARISEVDVARPGDPVLYTVDGAAVRVGGEGWEERLARLDGVLAELAARGERVASVDLRFRDLVVYVPRDPAARGDRETTTAGAPGPAPARPVRARSHP